MHRISILSTISIFKGKIGTLDNFVPACHLTPDLRNICSIAVTFEKDSHKIICIIIHFLILSYAFSCIFAYAKIILNNIRLKNSKYIAIMHILRPFESKYSSNDYKKSIICYNKISQTAFLF